MPVIKLAEMKKLLRDADNSSTSCGMGPDIGNRVASVVLKEQLHTVNGFAMYAGYVVNLPENKLT